MTVGIVLKYSATDGLGTILSEDSVRLSFSFEHGENLALKPIAGMPTFSGHHDQPPGFGLKHPEVGDVVIIDIAAGQVVRWGYMTHFTDLALRLALRAA